MMGAIAMASRGQQIFGVILMGVLCAGGYLRQRESSNSLLASVVGDYTDSSVGYTMDTSSASVELLGKTGGENALDVIFLYDPALVRVGLIETPYQYLLEDDDGLIRLRLEQLPAERDNTSLVSVQREGDLEGVIVSDIGIIDAKGDFRTLPVSNDSLCIGTQCDHDA